MGISNDDLEEYLETAEAKIKELERDFSVLMSLYCMESKLNEDNVRAIINGINYINETTTK